MAKANDIQVILVRCGRTDWDDANRLQGQTDLPLSAHGKEAAAAVVRDVANRMDGSTPAVVYTGPDEASAQTAEMLSGATGGTKIKSVDELAGLDLGIWDGLLESQLMERFPTAYREWKERPSSVNPPEGETFEDGATRVQLAMCRLLERANGKPVAFVLRPIPFGVASLWLSGQPMNDLWMVVEDGPQSERVMASREKIKAAMEVLKTVGTRQ